MTIPVLTWTRRTTTVSVAGATPTQAEIIDKLVAFIGTSTNWKITASAKDTPAAGQGYVEIAPVSAVAGVTEMRILITYSSETTPSALGAGNRMAPFAATTVPRLWAGIAVNASTTGPNANPWTSKAYTAAGWGGMLPLFNGASVTPNNGGELGIIESAEVLCLYFFSAANTLNGWLFGNFLEASDGNSSQCGMMEFTGWNSVPGGTTASFLIPGTGNSSAGATSTPKGHTVDAISTLQSVNRTQWDSLASLGGGYTAGSFAYLTAIILAGGAWGGGDIDVARGFLRQMRWGSKAFNGQVMTDGVATVQAIALNYHSSVAQTGTIWFDNFR